MPIKKMMLLIIAGGAISIGGVMTHAFSATTLGYQEMQASQGKDSNCYCYTDTHQCKDCHPYNVDESINCHYNYDIPVACEKGDASDTCECTEHKTNCGLYVHFFYSDCTGFLEYMEACNRCSEVSTESTECE